MVNLYFQAPMRRQNSSPSDTKTKEQSLIDFAPSLWALTDSNRRPSACKADALNQLS